ncbi:MAG TPA: AAA family ATPase, partial [Kofleriaceae bacterium]
MTDEDRPYITRARIRDYGCARDVTLELTRLHALIGPNDSGKSTVLSALQLAGDLIGRGQQEMGARSDGRHRDATILEMTLLRRANEVHAKIGRESGYWTLDVRWPMSGLLDALYQHPSADQSLDAARGATLVRWDPDSMRLPCDLISEGEAIEIGEKGEGLAAIYEVILSRDRPAFDSIEESVRRHFPTVKSLWLPTSGSQKALGVTLHDGTRVRANAMSEGMLYWLAFAALPHIVPTALLLVEEP